MGWWTWQQLILFSPFTKSLIFAILADLYDTFGQRCEKNSAWIVCCTPALYIWLVSHLFPPRGETRLPARRPLLMHREEGGKLGPTLSKQRRTVCQLVPRWKEGRIGILILCGGFPNVPLMGTRGCINYNPVLTIRQLGYPMRGAPLEEGLTPFIAQGFNSTNVGVLRRV